MNCCIQKFNIIVLMLLLAAYLRLRLVNLHTQLVSRVIVASSISAKVPYLFCLVCVFILYVIKNLFFCLRLNGFRSISTYVCLFESLQFKLNRVTVLAEEVQNYPDCLMFILLYTGTGYCF